MSLLVTLIFPVQAFKLLVSQICNHFSLLLFWNMYHPTQSVWLWAVYKIIKQQMQKKTTHTIKNQLKQYMAPRNISAHFDQKGWGNNQVLIAFPKAAGSRLMTQVVLTYITTPIEPGISVVGQCSH